ncbi:hypothetical protein C8N24_0338 [Solirubrobacter pauli]|uniref:Uncharacterized protein n=1 Tax=Solirubrobacter pauli TaxID=166793 RepID=A0A660L9F4_9ACTN|nr:hypothetical protein [Solirubrobacter pauli]RKQ90533.1 hypothetical protein C8N24_0338 [Solirubrobacter pauli]
MSALRLPTHPDGTISRYRDVLEREQTAVDGPKGHVLITRNGNFKPYAVWHSDQITTIVSTDDHAHAIRSACVAVGLDVQRLDFSALDADH